MRAGGSRRLLANARAAWEVPRDLLLRRYPAFVTGGPLPRETVPVFVFHGVEPEGFGRRLRYLADNGYRTLDADEHLDVLLGRTPPPERAVVLTLDDGRASVYGVAYPLLARHAMKAVVFLVPGRMRSRPGPLPPHWGDVEAGRARPQAVLERDAGPEGLLAWEEVEFLATTGVLEFQSHSLRHARVHTAPSVVGFVTPELRHGCAAFDMPLIHAQGHDLDPAAVPLGTPLLRSAPRLSEALRFYEDHDIRSDCVAAVAAAGGEAFFRRAGWERELRRALGRRPVPGRRETEAERRAAIAHELSASRALIELHTGRPVVHLCHPWHVAGPTARQLAREAGYRTAYCGKLAGTPITPVGGDPEAIARIGEDYLELLPGRGRADLASVLRRKWARRFGRARA